MENNLITVAEIERLAEMSALNFSDEDKERLIGEVGGIISMLDECGKIKTESKGVSSKVPLSALREDEFSVGLTSERVFVNAPSRDGDYFVVPEVNNGL